MMRIPSAQRLLLLLTCLLATMGTTRAQEKPVVFEVGYSAQLFFDVDANDAQAAMKVWIEKLVEDTGVVAETRVLIFRDPASLIQAAHAQGVDVVMLLPQEFLEVRDEVTLLPMLVPSIDGETTHGYVLLVSRDNGMTQLADLADKTLIIQRGNAGSIPRVWLDVLLRKSGHSGIHTHFRSVREVGKPSQAVLPVFFHQADACVVSRQAFATMITLNPQLERSLQVLAVSPDFLQTLLCFRPGLRQEYATLIETSLLALHTTPQGRQILNLFHLDELVPYQQAYLDNVISLFAAYHTLEKEIP